jgi:hypothetical protein
MKKMLSLILLLFALLACNFGVTTIPSPVVTPTVFLQSSDTPPPPIFTFTPEPSTGTITGTLSYPSEFLPPMRVVAFSLTDGNAYFVDTRDHGDYSLEVPAGTYYVVSYVYKMAVDGNSGQADSYTLNGGMEAAGGYTEMVLCNLYADCAPHTLVPVTVAAGQTVEAVNPGDWYAPSGTFPPMPNP